MLHIFDAMFINQLFRTNERGQTVFYPNGVTARGYLVPPEREPGVRAGVRWLTVGALIWTLIAVVIVPRAIEARLGYELPLAWFIAGVAVVVVATFVVIIRVLKQLTVGLEPVAK